MRTIEIAETSIVLRGSFNPAIFQPAWLAKNSLLREDEANEAKVEVIHQDVTVFATDWVAIQVTGNRFIVRCLLEGHDEELRDLVLGTFELLTHTPVTTMGINMLVHFKVESDEVWHEIGHRLVPKEGFWNDIMEEPGTLSLTVRGARPDEYKGNINVKIEPSQRVHPGLFIDINDHYEVQEKTQVDGASEMMQVLKASWEGAAIRRQAILNKALTL